MVPVTPAQVKAHVAAVRRKLPDAGVIGLQAEGVWAGGTEVTCGGTNFQVAPCVSELQIRDALRRHPDGPLVILTPLDATKLGSDVKVRLASRKLFVLSPKEVLLDLFQARTVDPRLLGYRWLVPTLIDRQPEAGYRPVPGGALDMESVWWAVLKTKLDLDSSRPDLETFFEWSLDAGRVSALATIDGDFRTDLESWLCSCMGVASKSVFAAIQSGRGSELIPLGLVLDVIESTPAAQALRDAKTRLEPVFGGHRISPEEAQSWAKASIAVVQKRIHAEGFSVVRGCLERLDAMLDELRIPQFASQSHFSIRGFEARLEEFAGQAEASMAGASPSTADHALGAIEAHFLSQLAPERVERCRMAVRLVRYLRGKPEEKPLLSAAADYSGTGGFVDWARHALYPGDGNGRLADCFAKLLKEVGIRREGEDRRFGRQLALALREGGVPPGILPVESVIRTVVGPLVAEVPVLLIVMDGMSQAVYRELLVDIERYGWSSLHSVDLNLPRPICAVLPSVTEISRKALFWGKVDVSAGDEAAGLDAQEAVLNLSKTTKPLLFRKSDLSEIGETGLPARVQTAIAQGKNRLVSVVVNVVDDHLLKGDQLSIAWNLAHVPALAHLLHAAKESGRIVVLVSDHGHVLERETVMVKGGAADRWRPEGDVPVGPDELVFSGDRIRAATGHNGVILPVTEGVRYSTKKNGYHGGATMQEVLIPLAILTVQSTCPKGWQAVPSQEPEWWNSSATDVPAAVPLPAKPKTNKKEAPQLPLFEMATANENQDRPSWIGQLMESPVLAGQLAMAGRAVPQRPEIEAFLAALEDRRYTVLRPALAQKLGMAPFRMNSFLGMMQRIMNVDGYDVLHLDSATDTVRLDRELLSIQFELK